MSAARHLHPDQLAMFMPAHELVNPKKTVLGDQESWQTHSEVREEKLTQAKRGGGRDNSGEMTAWYEAGHRETTFHEHIKQHGVQTPVTMSHSAEDPGMKWLIDGHHRAFSAADINPHLEVPVSWE